MMRKLFGSLFLLASFVAQAEPLYQVEIVVFTRESADAESEESWNKHYDLRYPAQTVVLQASDGSNSAYQLLPTDALQLTREAGVIEQRRGMRVLVHEAWLQPVDDPAHAKNIFISGGKTSGEHHELEGTFALGVEHFLRADANLWLSRFSSNDNNSVPTLPMPPGVISNTGSTERYPTAQTVVLQEQRRMRSGELHYFDHPKLGLLVLVTKKTEAP